MEAAVRKTAETWKAAFQQACFGYTDEASHLIDYIMTLKYSHLRHDPLDAAGVVVIGSEAAKFCHNVVALDPFVKKHSRNATSVPRFFTIFIDVSQYIGTQSHPPAKPLRAPWLLPYSIPPQPALVSTPASLHRDVVTVETWLQDYLAADNSLEGTLRAVTLASEALMQLSCDCIEDVSMIYVIFEHVDCLQDNKDDLMTRPSLPDRPNSTPLDILHEGAISYPALVTSVLQRSFQTWLRYRVVCFAPILERHDIALVFNTQQADYERCSFTKAVPSSLATSLGGLVHVIKLHETVGKAEREHILQSMCEQLHCQLNESDMMEKLVAWTSGLSTQDIIALVHAIATSTLLETMADATRKRTLLVEKRHMVSALQRFQPLAVRLNSTAAAFEFRAAKDWNDELQRLGDRVLGESKLCSFLESCVVEPFMRRCLWPYGVCLTGTTGSGKTFIVKAIAERCRANVLVVQPGSLMKSLLGESEKSLRRVFDYCKTINPCVAVFEDIDQVCPHVTHHGQPQSRDMYYREQQTLGSDVKQSAEPRPTAASLRIAEEFLRNMDELRLARRQECEGYDAPLSYHILVIVTTRNLQAVDQRLFQEHRGMLIAETRAATSWDIYSLFKVLTMHLPLSRLEPCAKYRERSLETTLLSFLQTLSETTPTPTPADMSALAERSGLACIRRSAAHHEKTNDDDTALCPSSGICLCDVETAVYHRRQRSCASDTETAVQKRRLQKQLS